MIMEKLLLSPEEAAESLGICRSRIYDLMRKRELVSVWIWEVTPYTGGGAQGLCRAAH